MYLNFTSYQPHLPVTAHLCTLKFSAPRTLDCGEHNMVSMKTIGVNFRTIYEVLAPSVPLSRSDKSSWNSSLKIASRLCFSSCCNFNIPRFSSALITWFSLRMRTAFMRRCREPLMTYPNPYHPVRKQPWRCLLRVGELHHKRVHRVSWSSKALVLAVDQLHHQTRHHREHFFGRSE